MSLKFLRKQYWFLHRYSQNSQKIVAEGTSYGFDAIDQDDVSEASSDNKQV